MGESDDPFDVAIEPAPKTPVVEAEEDEDEKRKRDETLASTYDPALAHDGKTEEELIAERQADGRLLLDAVIVTGIIVAAAEANEDDAPLEIEEAAEPEEGDASE